MKKALMFGLILLSAISCKAQTIVPVEKSIDYRRAGEGIPDNTYLKDVNNLLGKYIGIWKGSYSGKNYTLYITKTTSKFYQVTRDLLLIRYLITSSNGNILDDTRSVLDNSPFITEGSYFSKDLTVYALDFAGKNAMCGDAGTLFIRIKNTAKTQMSVSFEPDKIMITDEDCSGSKTAELTFPRNGLIMLTKQ